MSYPVPWCLLWELLSLNLNTSFGVKGDLLLAFFPWIDIRLCRTYSIFNFLLSLSSPFYLLLPFNFLLLLPACLLFVLFNLLSFLKMGTYYYVFTVICDMRPGNSGVTFPLGVKLCDLESSACRGSS